MIELARTLPLEPPSPWRLDTKGCQILADHGADVIKVEPASGELSRGARPHVEGESLYFACHNRGKRSVVLDLKSEQGLSALHALAAGADVLLTNYTVDVPTRLGWDYATLKQVNPGWSWCTSPASAAPGRTGSCGPSTGSSRR
jgi:crotonobetainyl-CoA:carnitine CoA-transferase CaiB-like acyl-CoA transferase